MDAVDQTAVVKEDALKNVKGETKVCEDAEQKTMPLSACGDGAGDLKSSDIDDIASVEKLDHTAADYENSDDLLKKIEEVVKSDQNCSEVVADSAIAQGSEQDFLKKLEELETESKAEDKAEYKANNDNVKIVEECVTSSDEREAADASTLSEIDEIDRICESDDIADSTSQELGRKVKETSGVRKEQKARPSEDITDLISSEDDENLAQKLIDIKRKDSIVEISSDEGSDENQDCKEIAPEIEDLTETLSPGKDKPLENGEVNTSEANRVSEISANPTKKSDKVRLTDSEVAEASDSEVFEISESEVEASESEVVESEIEKSIAQDKVDPIISKDDQLEKTVKTTKIIDDIATETMSIDESPVNADDTMEVDEEEKMDVDMAEDISENDEEMTVVGEEKVERKIVEGKTVVELETTNIDESVETTVRGDEYVSSTIGDVISYFVKHPTPRKLVDSGSILTPKKLVPIDDLESRSTSEPIHTKYALKTGAGRIFEANLRSPTKFVPKFDTALNPNSGKLPPKADLEPKSIPTKADSVLKSSLVKLPTKDDIVLKSISEEPEQYSTQEKLSPKADPESKFTGEKLALTSNAQTKSIEDISLSISEKVTPKSCLQSKLAIAESYPTVKPIIDAAAEAAFDKKEENVGNKSTDTLSMKSSVHLSDLTVSINSTSEELNITSADAEIDSAGKCIGIQVENKILANMMKHGSITSLNSSPVGSASAANVFNSTPIQKQFEISSENVSKISDVNEEGSAVAEAAITSKSDEESTDIGTTTTTETDNQTSDSVTKYLKVIKQYNGMTAEEKDNLPKTTSKIPHQADTDIPSAQLFDQYVINDYSDERGFRFLSVERLETKKLILISSSEIASGGDSSEKLSSNGSVSSLPQFTLPYCISEASLSSSQKTIDEKSLPGHIKRNQHTVTGIAGLIDHFTKFVEHLTKIKEKLEPSVETSKNDPNTPKSKVQDNRNKDNNKDKSSSPHMTETPTKKRILKRALNKSQSDDDDEIKPKSAKQNKTAQPKAQGTPAKAADSIESSIIGYCVLAKWIDKKYYAGKVTDVKIGNKFVILFEDGASKILPKDSIVFGEEDILPLKDQTVYALVDDDYESGVVKTIEKSDDKVIYTIEIEGRNINVSASDIYLTDQQAKAIQCVKDDSSILLASALYKNIDSPTEKSPGTSSRSTRHKRPPTSPLTPEAGFSGGVTKRGRRQKRDIQQTRISESSDISDSPETAPPNSPDSALEAIEGVQPELQKTPKESEITKMMIISDYMKEEPSCDIMELLGSLPTSKTLFKSKHFLLTCTVGQKLPPISKARNTNTNEISLTNKTQEFSTIPFIKTHLQKQIEEGGGKVYNHFEDVPKNKYKQCKLIASRPCTTAKYVQCLAADIQAISHEWVIESCDQNSLSDVKKYLLPSGWSITNDAYIRWAIGKSNSNRQSNKPFLKEIVLMASEHEDFVTFWSRVCKLAGATLRFIKSLSDITSTTTGYMVTEQDFPQMIKSKAEHYGIPIVSTLWIVQSLILGKVCDPHSHGKFSQIYQDDDL